MTADPAGPPAADPGSPPAAADPRVDAIEAEQKRQGELLEKIAAGVGAGAPAAAGDAAPDQAPLSLAEQVRREIKAADERRKAEEGEAAWRAGVDDAVEKVRAEHAPREPEAGVRARVQRLLFGRPD